jgi:GH15 family glucan-1,4-alpha-glucosidase
MYLVLMPDESLTDSAADYCNTTLEKTKRNWQEWVATLSVPIEYQQVVIRAAITLKLSSYEETGAIVASMTTSIPRSPNFITPNDYRYCFVRDAGAVVRALNSVGITKTMEDYLRFISNAISGFDEDGKENWLQPGNYTKYIVQGKR